MAFAGGCDAYFRLFAIVYAVAIVLVLPPAVVAAVARRKLEFLHLTLFVVGLCQFVFSLSVVVDPGVVAEWSDKRSLTQPESWYWILTLLAAIPLLIPMSWLGFSVYRNVAYGFIVLTSLAAAVIVGWSLSRAGAGWLAWVVHVYRILAPVLAFIYCLHRYSGLSQDEQRDNVEDAV